MQTTIVGRGRVGRGLYAALRASELEVTLTAGRAPRASALAEAELVVLAVPDSALAEVARSLATPLGRARAAIVHCSGSVPPEVLAPCRAAGAAIGAMHPLVSFADPRRPPSLAGTSFLIDGDLRAVRAAKRVATAVGARGVVAPVHGPAYHAAAALSANGAAALASVAVRVLSTLGLSARDAQRAIGALLRTVGENVERVGVPDALSGPVMRGDEVTVARHREALEALDPDARRAYDAVAPAILDCAKRAGLDPSRAEDVRRALRRRQPTKR